MSATNIKYKYVLKKEVVNKLDNDGSITFLALNTGVKYSTLKRQIKQNHEYLTLYSVLASISDHIGKPMDQLLTRAKA